MLIPACTMDAPEPLARVIRHPNIESDIKALRKFRTAKESLEAWERLFCARGLHEMPGISPYPGFGEREIYKARAIPLGEHRGKSGGYRIILERTDRIVFRILLISRHTEYKQEKELGSLIRSRL